MSARLGHVDWQLQLGDYLSALAVSPDGDLLVAGSLAGDVVLVETEGGAVVAKLHDHALGALAIDWSPDGERLVVGGQDAVARVYDRQGAELGAVTTDGWADRLAWSPTDDLLAVAGGRQLVLTDRNGGVVRRHDDVASTITDVVWATNGRRVGAAAYGGIAWYDPDDDDTLPRRFHRWKGSLLAVALSPDGKWACAGAQDASIHIWKLWSGDELAMSGYFSKIEHLAFSADSRWLACSCLELLTWWDFFGKGPRDTAPASGEFHTKAIASLAWQPDGELLVTGGADGRVVLWDAPSRQAQTVRPLDADQSVAGVSGVVWHPDGARLFVGRDDGTVEHRSIED
ncbi:MAG: hypothetical protein AAGD33_02185 [Actinomycetota bacterium]